MLRRHGFLFYWAGAFGAWRRNGHTGRLAWYFLQFKILTVTVDAYSLKVAHNILLFIPKLLACPLKKKNREICLLSVRHVR